MGSVCTICVGDKILIHHMISENFRALHSVIPPGSKVRYMKIQFLLQSNED